jgi:hypothetical protein
MVANSNDVEYFRARKGLCHLRSGRGHEYRRKMLGFKFLRRKCFLIFMIV